VVSAFRGFDAPSSPEDFMRSSPMTFCRSHVRLFVEQTRWAADTGRVC
jgi:hypothetical protein